MCALFSPEMLQAGAVKGLNKLPLNLLCVSMLLFSPASRPRSATAGTKFKVLSAA